MNNELKKLHALFTEIVENHSTFGAHWRNIELGRQAFAEMTERLPLRVEGELTPYTRIVLLGKMLECMPQTDCARFVLQVRKYQEAMFPLIAEQDLMEDMDIDEYQGDPAAYVREYTIDDLRKDTQKMADYVDLSMTTEAWCEKYGQTLLFDDVERTEMWEQHICEVEREVDSLLKDEPKRMGYCFTYWSTKRTVLLRHGIKWSSPSAMNPHVMFD